MQQRLNDMNPMMFGDTMRLPVFNTKQNFNITSQAAAATPEPAKWRVKQVIEDILALRE